MQCDFLAICQRQRQLAIFGEPFQMRGERFDTTCFSQRSKQLHIHIASRIAAEILIFLQYTIEKHLVKDLEDLYEHPEIED